MRTRSAVPELEDLPGRLRVEVENISPRVGGGRYAIKRVLGEAVRVEADLVADGHDRLSASLMIRREGTGEVTTAEMSPEGNDRWSASFVPKQLGRYSVAVVAWVDDVSTFLDGFRKKVDADLDLSLELRTAADLVKNVAARAATGAHDRLASVARTLLDETKPQRARARVLLDSDVAEVARARSDLTLATRVDAALSVVVDPVRAGFSAWYEMFPRSCGESGSHGTFRDAEKRLPYVRELGFDVLYLPPIHPIGTTHRKGKNNQLTCEPDDVGSPWAIGAGTGGHKAIHPDLGTPEDFRRFVQVARSHGIDVALDIAFQASPDHPWVTDHPEWFIQRPDGSIQYAENPPKKYEDIYPINFQSEDWKNLWCELRSVFEHWIEQGVRIFRVDNPHTKSLRFWEWCLRSLKREHPDLIFLSEAFTRPKLMYNLAKAGFTQSYTYFTWRYSKADFEQYLTELTRTEVREYFRPNFWPNTPDILMPYLTEAGRPAFVARLVLASTLSSNYGIYGPAFELMERTPRPGAEEYLDNEKYQLRDWELEREDSLRHLIARINHVRRQHASFQRNDTLRFHHTDNDQLLCYSKHSDDDAFVVVVNLDPHHIQSGFVSLDLGRDRNE